MGQFSVVVNAKFPGLQWNVDPQNNTITFRGKGSSLLNLQDGTTKSLLFQQPPCMLIHSTLFQFTI